MICLKGQGYGSAWSGSDILWERKNLRKKEQAVKISQRDRRAYRRLPWSFLRGECRLFAGYGVASCLRARGKRAIQPYSCEAENQVNRVYQKDRIRPDFTSAACVVEHPCRQTSACSSLLPFHRRLIQGTQGECAPMEQKRKVIQSVNWQ